MFKEAKYGKWTNRAKLKRTLVKVADGASFSVPSPAFTSTRAVTSLPFKNTLLSLASKPWYSICSQISMILVISG